MFLGICCATRPRTWALQKGLVAGSGSVIYKICWILQPPRLEVRTNCWASADRSLFFWSRVLSKVMPEWTLTPIQQCRFFPLELTSRVVVSYIPERRVKAEEQNQGTADGPTDAFVTLCFLRVTSKSIRAQGGNVEWQNGHTGTLDAILWASLRSNNQVQVLADQSGNGHTNSDSWGYPRPLRATGSSHASSFSLALELGMGRTGRGSKAILPRFLLFLHPPKPALRPASNARTERDKKMSSSSLKWHKIAKTTRRERWWSCWKDNWNNLKDSALFSLLSAWRRYLDKGF